MQGVISLSDLQFEQSGVPLGALFAVISAFFYAVYLVFLRKKVDHEDRLDIPMFFGKIYFYVFLFSTERIDVIFKIVR